jgi:hypothetical protein
VIGALTFITAFALSCAGLLGLRHWRRRRTGANMPRKPRGQRLTGRAAADWPRTTRVLPWSVAGLITMVWLTPFDRIQLSISTPVNITLDRVVLPMVAIVWLIAFATGPDAAPRLRITRVHVAIGAFLACAFLSVVLDDRYLDHNAELTLALKKLPLLVSYMSIFVIVASSVRRSEVPAFMTFTLIVAVICGLGVIFEYRFHQNLFDIWSHKLFRGPFQFVTDGHGSALDAQGRRWVQGPAVSGLELVAMLSIALPIPVLGVLKSKARWQKILYGIAIVVLLAAMFATNRKSALLAPAAVFLTLAYFRRRELLSLAPLGLVIIVLVPAIAPGAVHDVVLQFTRPDASHVATVDSRTANYDAIRPELFAHLLFGRGQGTYAPPTDRIVDSEILMRLVETGVLGLATFLLIPLSVILVLRRTASSGDAKWSSPAICGVAAAVCFLVVATLYTVMIAPHGSDAFLYIAGLAVAVLGRETVPPLSPRTVRRHELPKRRARMRLSIGAVSEPAVPAGLRAEVREVRQRLV